MKLSKISIPYRAVKTSGSILAIGLFTSLETANVSPNYVLVILALFFGGSVLMLSWFYLVWKNFDFEITSDTFDIRSGVFRKKEREIPLHRIQNVDVRRNIFQRFLGIAQVNLETAGGQTSEASLKFVDFNQAKQVQKKVRELKQEKTTENEDDVDDVSPIFSLSEKELGILSATSLDWRAVSVIFVGLSLFGGLFSTLESVIGLTGLALVIPLVLVLVLLSFGFSAASNINKYYGFRLFRRGDSLEYERGLLNRSEGSIPFEKIQNLRIEENPLKRLVGYATLKVETAGYSGQGQEQSGPEVAVPLAEKKRVEQLSNEIFEHGNYNIQGVSRNAFRRYFGRYTLFLTVPAALLIYISTAFSLGIIPLFVLGLVPVAGVAAYLKYVNKGFYEGQEFFYTMNGFWKRTTSITPYYRIQNLVRSQTVFQKRLNVSTLVLDTAGIYTFGSNPKACDLDDRIAENLFERVYESFKSSTKN